MLGLQKYINNFTIRINSQVYRFQPVTWQYTMGGNRFTRYTAVAWLLSRIIQLSPPTTGFKTYVIVFLVRPANRA